MKQPRADSPRAKAKDYLGVGRSKFGGGKDNGKEKPGTPESIAAGTEKGAETGSQGP